MSAVEKKLNENIASDMHGFVGEDWLVSNLSNLPGTEGEMQLTKDLIELDSGDVGSWN